MAQSVNLFKNFMSLHLAKEQQKAAKNLKETDYTKDALASQDLALQQAYSRRSPGASYAEEMIRRNSANQVGAALRMYGGDVNKVSAVASSANAQANDATLKLATQGQAFSEQAFNRLYMAKRDIASGRREYRNYKQQLQTSAQQNAYDSFPGLF